MRWIRRVWRSRTWRVRLALWLWPEMTRWRRISYPYMVMGDDRQHAFSAYVQIGEDGSVALRDVMVEINNAPSPDLGDEIERLWPRVEAGFQYLKDR